MRLVKSLILGAMVLGLCSSAGAQNEKVTLECRGGQYFEDGTRRVAGGDFHCAAHPGLDAVAISMKAATTKAHVPEGNTWPDCSLGIACVTFFVTSPVPADQIQVITLKGHEGKSETDRQLCFETRVKGGASNWRAEPSQGTCAIDWSGWASVSVGETTKAVTVAGTFKNWSADRDRWGSLWVWYSPKK